VGGRELVFWSKPVVYEDRFDAKFIRESASQCKVVRRSVEYETSAVDEVKAWQWLFAILGFIYEDLYA